MVPAAVPGLLSLPVQGLEFPSLMIIMTLFLLIGLGGTILWIWMLIDCATKEAETGNTKIVWALIVALTHVVGALIYLFVRRPQRIAELGR